MISHNDLFLFYISNLDEELLKIWEIAMVVVLVSQEFMGIFMVILSGISWMIWGIADGLWGDEHLIRGLRELCNLRLLLDCYGLIHGLLNNS